MFGVNYFKNKEKQRKIDERNAIKAEILKEIEKEKIEKQKKNIGFIKIHGIINDPKEGVKTELDWNEEFITHLKRNGYTGTTDNEFIVQYITEFMHQIIEDIMGNSSEFS